MEQMSNTVETMGFKQHIASTWQYFFRSIVTHWVQFIYIFMLKNLSITRYNSFQASSNLLSEIRSNVPPFTRNIILKFNHFCNKFFIGLGFKKKYSGYFKEYSIGQLYGLYYRLMNDLVSLDKEEIYTHLDYIVHSQLLLFSICTKEKI